MSHSVAEPFQAPELWACDIGYTPVVRDLLVDDQGRPRKLWVMVRRVINDALMYPPMVVLHVDGDEMGIHLEALGPLWSMGSGGVGPMITDREFVSGADKLDNGSFDLDDLYWRTEAEGSGWVLAAGAATNAGGYDGDDVLESDRKFPTRPGHSYQAIVSGVWGSGRLKVRTIYEGRFAPQNLWLNGNLAAGAYGWTGGTYAAIVDDADNAYDPASSTYVMRCLPIPKPVLNSDPGLETGGGWSDVLSPAPMSDDIDIVNDPANAHSGSNVMRVGPITQHQVFQNADFGTGRGTQTIPLPPIREAPPASALAAAAAEQADLAALPSLGLPSKTGLAEGATGRDVAALQAYLTRYGYLRPSMAQGLAANPDAAEFDRATTEALKRYQRFYKLRVTGRLTRATIDYMRRPRCGVPDRGQDGSTEFVVGSWGPYAYRDLYYSIQSRITDLSESVVDAAIADAFSKWAAVSGPGLTFTLGSGPPERPQADSMAFRAEPPHVSGEGAVADCTIFEDRSCAITFYDEHTFQMPPTSGGYNFLFVAMHEIGHALGLEHSNVEGTVMNSGGAERDDLHADDIAGLQYLYPASTMAATDIPYWYQSSTDAEPHEGIFALDAGGGVDGNQGVITIGWSTAGFASGPLIKYLRADKTDGGGVDPYDVSPGDNYRAEAYAHGHPGTDGSAYIAIMIPHPSVSAGDLWIKSEEIFAPPHDDNRWTILAIDNITIGENRTLLNALFEVHNHSLGYWSVDHFTLTRTRGNRARIVSTASYPVDTDARYEVAAMVKADGSMTGTVRVGVILEGDGMTDQTEGEDRSGTDYVWDRAAKEFRPPTGYTHARLSISGLDILGSSAYVDDITITKLDNNRDSITASHIGVIPERPYKAKVKVRSGLGLQRGNVRLEMRFTRTGYPDLTVESQTMDNTEGEWKELSFDITPPSGYDTVAPRVVFTDVEGAPFYASHFSLVDNDTGTVVFDAYTVIDPVAASFYVDSVAPDGTESVRVAVIAEQGSSSWTVNSVLFKRTGVTPSTGAAIIAELLTDPETGLPLSLAPGTISAGDVIPYDWVVQNQTNREAFEHLCNVVYDGGLEFYVTATDPPTLNVGASVDVFDDHGPGSAFPITLLPEDPDVRDLSNPEADAVDRATIIRLIGAERETVSGRPFLVSADAVVPGEVELDYNGSPIVRVKIVSDATVDHHGYAQAYAADLALREAEPPMTLTGTLDEVSAATATALGLDPRPDFKVGDWIYAYHPEGGLDDDDITDTIEGVTVHPRRVRVLSRERALGPGYYVQMRRSDGTTFDLPGIIPSPEDVTQLTIGDREFPWDADPQGSAAGIDYERFRKSMPR